MISYIVLLLAVLSRFVPHAMHGVGLNFTAVGGGLLYFGARRPRREAVIAAALMALSDVCLTRLVYGFPFHLRGYVVTWLWYGAVCLLGSGLLRRVTALRVVSAVLASSTSFLVLSNAVVWLRSGMYPHTAAGLAACFTAALPFYANDLVSTSLTCGVLFGLPAVARRMREAMTAGQRQPLA